MFLPSFWKISVSFTLPNNERLKVHDFFHLFNENSSNEEKLCTNKVVPEVRINFVFFIKQSLDITEER